VTKNENLAIGPFFYSIITVFDIILPGSRNPAGIPGLEIPQFQITGLRKRIWDWNPYSPAEAKRNYSATKNELAPYCFKCHDT